MTEPEDFVTLKGATIPRKLSVDDISFSAHVDYSQNAEFIETVKAQHVVSNMYFYIFQYSFNYVILGSSARGAGGNGALACRYDFPVQRTR